MRSLLHWLSLRHWTQHPTRAALTLVGVGLGVAITVAVDLIGTEILASHSRTLDAVAGKAQLTVTRGEAGMERSIADAVFKVKGVQHVEPLLEKQLVEPGRGPILLLGIDFLGDDSLRQVEAKKGDEDILEDPIAFLNSTQSVVVPYRFATTRKLKKGDTFFLTTQKGKSEFIIKGFVEDKGPARAFGGDIVMMYLDAAQAVLDMQDRISRVDIGLEPGANLSEVRQAISKALGNGYEVDVPRQRSGRLEDLMTGLRHALLMMAALAIWIGMLLAYNAVEISVRQRKGELAIIRALGAKRSVVLGLVLTESLVLGVLATLLGLALGYFLAIGGVQSTATSVSEIYDTVKIDEISLTPRSVVVAFIVGIVMPIAGAMRPAMWLASQPPVLGLQSAPEQIGAGPTGNRLWLFLGSVALVGGLLVFLHPSAQTNVLVGYAAFAFVLLGAAVWAPSTVTALARATHALFARTLLSAETVIALDHIERDRRRAALNIASLVAGVTTVVTIATYVHALGETNRRWLDSAVPADIFVTAGQKLAMTQNIPIDPEFGNVLTKVPGVDAVFRARIADVTHKGRPIKITSIEMEGFLRRSKPIILQGEVRLDGPTARGEGVLISENLAHFHNYEVGQTIYIESPTGTHPMVIEAVVVDFTSDKGVIVMDRVPYVRFFEDPYVDSFDLFLTPGAEPRSIQQSIRRDYGTKYDLFVLTNQEVKTEAQRVIDQFFSLLDLLQLVTLVIAILGVSTTLVASVLDRTQEVGVMRAVGTFGKQIIRIVLTEATFLGTTSTLVGVLLGTVTGYLFLRSILVASVGWAIPYYTPVTVYVSITVGIFFASMVAGIYPAWWIAKQPTLDALRAE